MAQYHTLFTSIELSAPFEPHPASRDNRDLVITPRHSFWLGRIGESQVGPVHIGWR